MRKKKETRTAMRAKRVNHSLIGRDVWFKGRVWRVTSAHSGDSQGTPWLTLRRGFGLEALAKSYEVQEAFN